MTDIAHSPELLSLLQECRQAPDEVAPRLVLADWLEDNGQPDRADCVRISCRLETLPPFDLRRDAGRAALDDPRRETGRWLEPLRKRFPNTDFHGGLVRLTTGPLQLLALGPEEVPADYLPWLETLRLRGFTTNYQLMQLARRGWLRLFSSLDLDQTGLGDGALQALFQDVQSGEKGHLGHLARLDFRYNQLSIEGVRALVESERELPALRCLTLSSNRYLGDRSVELLAGSPLLGRLTSLGLYYTNLMAGGVTALANSRYAGNLVHLDLGLNPIGAAGLLAICRSRRLNQLRSLSLTTGNFDRKAFQHLEDWPTDRPLERLDLSANSSDPVALARSPVLRSLKELDLGSTTLTPRALRALLGALPGPGLERLELRRGAMGDEGAEALADCAALESLRDLRLEETGLGPRGVRALAQSPHLRNLECLTLENNRLGPEGLMALTRGTMGGRKGSSSPAIDPFPCLRALSLNRTRPTRQGIEALAGSALLGRLEILDLGNNRLGAAGAQALADSPRLGNLRHLNLNTCSLGAEGIKHLAGSAHLAGLRSLNLWQNHIGDAGVAALIDSPHLGNLTSLVLRFNKISESGGLALLDWKPGEWALFDVHDNRITPELLVRLTAKGVKER